jgi:hypothetical protein
MALTNETLNEWLKSGVLAPAPLPSCGASERHSVIDFSGPGAPLVTSFGHVGCAKLAARALQEAGRSVLVTSSNAYLLADEDDDDAISPPGAGGLRTDAGKRLRLGTELATTARLCSDCALSSGFSEIANGGGALRHDVAACA